MILRLRSVAFIVPARSAGWALEKPRGGEARGAGKRSSVLLGEHDGENAQRLLGIGRVFGPELGLKIVIID